MADYLSREEILRVFDNLTVKNPDDKYQHGMQDAIDCLIPEVINGMEAADAQPLSVVAEHIKNRLYETAFNTTNVVASDVIADMAERIDFWIGELKDGDKE